MLLLVACLIALVSSQNTYETVGGFDQLDCVGNVVIYATTLSTTCLPATCINNVSIPSFSGAKSLLVTCQADPFPYGQLQGLVTYNSSDCTGVVSSNLGISPSLCITTSPTSSRTLDTCDSSGGKSFSTPDCTGASTPNNPTPVPPITDCIVVSPTQSEKLVCTAVCFHEDTPIVYQGISYTMSDLKNSPLCAIPHIVKSNGVKISTSCPGQLRLTHEHLVYSHAGLVAAGTVKVGDFLFADMNEKVPCQVTKVEQEYAQTYFGLNCEESDVLASGYKTSTFGIFHAVPAMWMKYGSKILGVHTASAVGDSVASVLATFRLI